MKKDDIILTIVISLAFGLVALFVILAYIIERTGFSQLFITCALIVITLTVHWIVTGHRAFKNWLFEDRGFLCCVFGAFLIVMLVGAIFNQVFFTALFLIVPLVILSAVMERYQQKRKLSLYIWEYEEKGRYYTKYKCHSCKGEIIKVLLKTVTGKKKIEYKCLDCTKEYEINELKSR